MYNLAFTSETIALRKHVYEADRNCQETFTRDKCFDLQLVLFRNQPPGSEEQGVYTETLIDIFEEDLDTASDQSIIRFLSKFKSQLRLRAIMTHGVVNTPDLDDVWTFVTSYDSPETRFTLTHKFTIEPKNHNIVWIGETENSYHTKVLFDCFGVHIFDEYRRRRDVVIAEPELIAAAVA